MSSRHTGQTIPAITQEEHHHPTGHAGAQRVDVKPYSYYQAASLASGYVYHGFTAPSIGPSTAAFKIMRETLDTGEVLFAGGTADFAHTWSAASISTVPYS